MSTTHRAESLRLLNYEAILAQDCSLCGAASGDALVCAPCEAALPRAATRCARCAIPLAHAGTCGECLRRPPAFDATLARFDYAFPVDRLVQRFKYAGDLAIGRWLGEALAAAVQGEKPHVIVAPPSTRERLRERGFNPALEIAKVVGRTLAIPQALTGLVRVRETAPQPGLERRARSRNLEGALRCDLALEGAHVALVDDVMTTGATANAAAGVLKAAGAARVSVWVAARTPDPHV